MNEKIVLCDKEGVFVSLLARQLKKSFQPKDLTVLAYDDAEKMFSDRDAIKGNIVVLGEGLLDAFQTEELIASASMVLYLTEEKRAEGIFKYRSAPVLAGQIMEKILQREDLVFAKTETLKREKEARIIGLYSPARDLLQSMLGMNLGQILAKQQRVLYLNFEPFSGLEYLMRKEFSHDLTDLLFFIRNNEERFLWRLRSMVEKAGEMDYIPPVFSYPDLEETDPKYLVELVDRIARESDYETVILDLCDNRSIFPLLRRCDEIFCLYQDNGLAQAKVDQFEKMLAFLKEEEIGSHTRLVKLPFLTDYPRDVFLQKSTVLADFIRKEMLTEDV